MEREFEEKEEQDFLVSRINDINRAIKEDPKQEKYWSMDLASFEEELQMLQQHKLLKSANRKIRKYLREGKSNHPKSTSRLL